MVESSIQIDFLQQSIDCHLPIRVIADQFPDLPFNEQARIVEPSVRIEFLQHEIEFPFAMRVVAIELLQERRRFIDRRDPPPDHRRKMGRERLCRRAERLRNRI